MATSRSIQKENSAIVICQQFWILSLMESLKHTMLQKMFSLFIVFFFIRRNLKSTSYSFGDMTFMDERHKRIQTFKNKLFSQSDKCLVKESIIHKIAESGLPYNDLQYLFLVVEKKPWLPFSVKHRRRDLQHFKTKRCHSYRNNRLR